MGAYNTFKIGRYLNDVKQTMRSNDSKALRSIDSKYDGLNNELQTLLTDRTLRSKSKEELYSMFPIAISDSQGSSKSFKDVLDAFIDSPSNAKHADMVSILEKRINKIFAHNKAEAREISYKTMEGNRDKMIESCLPLVITLAKYYLARSKSAMVSIEDLVQAGNLGLVLAADKYMNTPYDDTAKPKAKFSSYAWFWIRKYIHEEVFIQSTPMGSLSKHKDNWHATHETKWAGGDPLEDVNNDKKSPSIWDKLPKIDSETEKMYKEYDKDLNEIQKRSKDLFAPLSPEEKRVLFGVYGIDTPDNQPMNYDEVGRLIGKSKSTVSRMVTNMMHKLKVLSNKAGGDKDLLATLSIIQGIDLSKVPAWTMDSTYVGENRAEREERERLEKVAAQNSQMM